MKQAKEFMKVVSTTSMLQLGYPATPRTTLLNLLLKVKAKFPLAIAFNWSITIDTSGIADSHWCTKGQLGLVYLLWHINLLNAAFITGNSIHFKGIKHMGQILLF